MPELAEVKLMSDYINQVCEGRDFTGVTLSEHVERRLPFKVPKEFGQFKISSIARGKELRLILEGKEKRDTVSFSMGMTGYWSLLEPGESNKHQHMTFNGIDGTRLALIDPRRFAKWTLNFSKVRRGPCPLEETAAFMYHVMDSLKSKVFSKPIHLALMDQRYFNGIGNYLRAEILFRAGQDPFQTAREAIISNPKILDLCRQVPLEAYLIGGGQLKDWVSPFQVPKEGFLNWLQCYGKSDCSYIDITRRRLWYFKSQIKNDNLS